MRRVNQVVAFSFLLLSFYVIWEASKLHYYTKLGPGPGFFPLWLGIGLAALSFAWLVQTSRSLSDPIPEDFVPPRLGVARVISILLALAFFVSAAAHLGFRLSALIFLVFLLSVLGRQKLAVTAVISLLGSFGVYYVFVQWLEVPLPDASLEFLQILGL